MWFKKKPVTPKEIEVDFNKVLGQLFEFKPDVKYVLWFDSMISPQHIIRLREVFKNRDVNIGIVAGMVEPTVYEFKEGE